jgi:hypothetical protein
MRLVLLLKLRKNGQKYDLSLCSHTNIELIPDELKYIAVVVRDK